MCDSRYEPYFEGPEAKLARDEMLREERRQREDERAIDGLLASLRPEEARHSLFTNDERKFWGITNYRKRVVE